jgi:hypothetical protein
VSVAVDFAASDYERVKREIVRLLSAHNGAGGDIRLRPGTVVDGFRILRSAEPDSEAYVVEFECERLRLTCPLYTFLPRTRAVV